MSKDIKDMDLPLQKVIDRGTVDAWLRKLVNAVPKSAEPGETEAPATVAGIDVIEHNPNTFTTLDSAFETLKPADIETMQGFHRLIATCSRNNVRVDMSLLGHGALEVSFIPTERFRDSQVFGRNYNNVSFLLSNKPGLAQE